MDSEFPTKEKLSLFEVQNEENKEASAQDTKETGEKKVTEIQMKSEEVFLELTLFE